MKIRKKYHSEDTSNVIIKQSLEGAILTMDGVVTYKKTEKAALMANLTMFVISKNKKRNQTSLCFCGHCPLFCVKFQDSSFILESCFQI